MSLTEAELAEIVARVTAELGDLPTPTPQVIDNTRFQVVTGQVIQADHVNSLANQSIPKYANQNAATSDWPSPPVGAMAYLQDINALIVYDAPITGGANVWHVMGGLRMGHALMGGTATNVMQVIPSGAERILTLRSVGGAANKAGRGTWNTDGSVTLPFSGTYLVNGTITWPSSPTGDRALYIKRFDGTSWTFTGVAGGAVESNTPGTSYLRMSVSAMVAASASEKVALSCYQASGANMTMLGGVESTRLAVHMLGAE